MYILAIDSATPVACVALVKDSTLLAERFLNFKKTHSETLMSMVDQVLGECEITVQDLTAIAVTIGPGSFTGLRIGLAAAKGLSLAADRPLVGISTLEVMAHNIVFSDSMICPLLDARKQEVYTAFFDVTGIYPQRLTEDMACSPAEMIERVLTQAEISCQNKITLLGDGYAPYADFFKERLQGRLLVPPAHLMLPRAAALGSLACLRARQEDYNNAFYLRPVYVRLSEAEHRLGKGEL